MERYERGPLMPDNPRLRRGLNAWAIALWVLGAALVITSLYVAIWVMCWYGCVTPFDETWERRIEAAAIARDEAAALDEGRRLEVALPDEYADLSESGEAIVERVDGELVVIFFQGGPGGIGSAMVHAPSGVAERGQFLDEYCIDSVHSQGSSWYEVFLNDYLPVLGHCR
jgi:hypothetical protein